MRTVMSPPSSVAIVQRPQEPKAPPSIDLGRRRSKFGLMREILAHGSGRLVDLQRATRATPSQLLRTLPGLVDLGLVEVVSHPVTSTRVYRSTPKGEQVLGQLGNLSTAFEGFPL